MYALSYTPSPSRLIPKVSLAYHVETQCWKTAVLFEILKKYITNFVVMLFGTLTGKLWLR